jgi:hypothetical protein
MAKHMKVKLPKRIAGIKIPKVVRNGPLGRFLNSSAGQLVLAETLLATAAVFTAKKTDDDSTVGDSLRHPMDGARRVGRALTATGSDQSERLAHACRAAGRAFRDALHEEDGVWQKPEALDTRDGRAKKKSSTRASSHTQH